jgi:uncharacterized membrane protein YjjP (DUF1212 family)
MKLGTALHRQGAPTHRIEEALSSVTRRLGVEAQFFSLPTSLHAAFGPPGRQTTILARTEPGAENLERLARLDAILGRIERGELHPAAAEREVDAVLAAPDRYGTLWLTLAMVVATAGAARIFGGGWREMVTAAAIGGVAAALGRLARANQRFARIFEATAALCAGVLATAASVWLAPTATPLAMLGGLIVLVPGLTLTVAMTEVASRHLSAGTARLTAAIVTFLAIGFGAALGTRLGVALFGVANLVAPTQMPPWTLLPVLALTPLAFGVLLQAHPRDLPGIIAACLVAYGGARFGSALLGPELGVLVGAVLVGAASNVYASGFDRPASVTLVPGILLLVPGSLGFRSISALLEQDVERGTLAAFSVGLIATALVTGLLMAQVLVPPRRSL